MTLQTLFIAPAAHTILLVTPGIHGYSGQEVWQEQNCRYESLLQILWGNPQHSPAMNKDFKIMMPRTLRV